MKKFFKILSCTSLVCSCFILLAGTIVSSSIPNAYQITENSGMELQGYFPVTAKTVEGRNLVAAEASMMLNKTYDANILLMNSIPIKTVDVQMVEETKVIPCGTPFGVKIFTQGVVIVGISDVKTEQGVSCPAKTAGLRKGDIILSINEQKVTSNEEIAEIVEKSGGETLIVLARRDNTTFQTELFPIQSFSDGMYKVGIWVRDSSAGIGTLTFFDPQTNRFAGLGHGICDIDTGELLPLSHGDIVKANINGITKGVKGTPGELKGYFSDYHPIGNLQSNSASGVYGVLKECPCNHEPIVVGMKQQVKTGKAQILTTISGESPQYYDIEIVNVNYNEDVPTKNMVISITDPRLLEQTGGIVQGMSGSPIIKDGRLIGAVTHVFVNEPTKGYAIFAENMLAYSRSSAEQRKAS